MLFVFDDLFLILISHCWRPFLYSTFLSWCWSPLACRNTVIAVSLNAKESDLSFHTFASDSEMKIIFRIPQRRSTSSCHQAG